MCATVVNDRHTDGETHMNDWRAGYVTDLAYTFGYYPELNPLRIRLAFLNQGLAFPQVGSACELGFGQGVSTNLHASASVTQWCGTDFNPSQAGFAQELAASSGAGVLLAGDAFADFAQRTDLPDFDFIALHGIWSWISDDNRRVIVDFVRRKLKVGGVLYISYNTLPGWSNFLSVRHLLAEHARVLGASGDTTQGRIHKALGFVQQVMDTEPMALMTAPGAADQLRKMQSLDPHYIAHEFFNRDWQPMHFSTVAQWLEGAKLQFACSASYMDALESMHLTAEQIQLLGQVPDKILRQGVTDVMLNRRFRKDYWVKGERSLSPRARIEQLRQQRLLMVSQRADVSLTVKAYRGEVQLTEALYLPLIDLMKDHKPRSLGEIEVALASLGINGGQLLLASLLMVELGHFWPVQEDEVAQASHQACVQINQRILSMSRDASEVQHLASPVTGGGIAVSRFEQLFILAMQEGHLNPQDWALFAWAALSAQGQTLIKEGKSLQTPEENQAELLSYAVRFSNRLPVLRALQIIAQ